MTFRDEYDAAGRLVARVYADDPRHHRSWREEEAP
jgi:YD repeat-containing protein